MLIEIVTCDRCHESLYAQLAGFTDAPQWYRGKVGDQWFDLCPDCRKKDTEKPVQKEYLPKGQANA